MLYIVTALKIEAQAFVDKYKLQKRKYGKYKVFQNKEMIVIISGIGVFNSMLATQTLINQFDITDDDIYLNIGICGANENYEIGELIEISSLSYKEQNYELNSRNCNTITCVDEEMSSDIYDIVDMESFGFYDAVIHSPAIKNRYILKVVSDHFKPSSVTKDKTKALIFNVIDDINEIIFQED